MRHILAVNPGSTSTKLAVYQEKLRILSHTLEHDRRDLEACGKIHRQLGYRLGLIYGWLKEQDFPLSTLSAVVGRGGLLPPVKTGGYLVNQAMLDQLKSESITPHASNLGAMLAYEIARPLGIPAYIYDAVSSAELLPEARVTGFPEAPRNSFCHVLNSRASAIKCAEARGRAYEDMNFIVAHLGGGITFSAHRKGKIIDSMADDDGAFAPERSGGIPLLQVVNLCYGGAYTREEMLQKVRGKGGLVAHLGTADCRKIEAMILDGDGHAALVYKAQALQIAKGVCVMAAALSGELDSVILTGGVAHSRMLTDMVAQYVGFLGPVEVWPGENEMEALALGCLRILGGEQAHIYGEEEGYL